MPLLEKNNELDSLEGSHDPVNSLSDYFYLILCAHMVQVIELTTATLLQTSGAWAAWWLKC